MARQLLTVSGIRGLIMALPQLCGKISSRAHGMAPTQFLYGQEDQFVSLTPRMMQPDGCLKDLSNKLIRLTIFPGSLTTPEVSFSLLMFQVKMALPKTVFLVAAIWMSLATLPAEPKEAPPASSPFAWRFFLTENWTEHAAAYKGKNWKGALLATADCPLAGCQKPLSLNFPKFNKINIGKWPMICFFYDQTLDYCKNDYVEQSLGCPYKTCRYHISQKVSDDKAALNTVYKKNTLFKTAQGYSLIIWDPWDPRWTSKVRGGAYVSYYAPSAISHIYIWRTYVQVQSMVHVNIQHQEELLNQQLESASKAKPFSWLSLMREGLMLASISGIGNLSRCFLCAALDRPPLIAVPVLEPNWTYTAPAKVPIFIPDVGLYETTSRLPFCLSTPNTSLCNSTSWRITPAAPPGIFIWCNGTLTKNFSLPKDSSQLCIPTMLVPQLNLLTPADVAQRMLDPPRRNKRAVFLPLIAGIALASSAVAAGLAGGSLGYSIHSYSSLSQQFEMAIEASAESLASLQRQLSSLARVTLQNRRALDLLTADKGGTCLFLGEECCYYVNESGVVEEQVKKLHEISLSLRKQKFSSDADSWWNSTVFSLLMPLAGPIISLLLLVSLGPFIFNKITKFIKQQIESLTSRPLQAHYHRLDLLDRGIREPEADDPTGTA